MHIISPAYTKPQTSSQEPSVFSRKNLYDTIDSIIIIIIILYEKLWYNYKIKDIYAMSAKINT